jgi:hypothetical protein
MAEQLVGAVDQEDFLGREEGYYGRETRATAMRLVGGLQLPQPF